MYCTCPHIGRVPCGALSRLPPFVQYETFLVTLSFTLLEYVGTARETPLLAFCAVRLHTAKHDTVVAVADTGLLACRHIGHEIPEKFEILFGEFLLLLLLVVAAEQPGAGRRGESNADDKRHQQLERDSNHDEEEEGEEYDDDSSSSDSGSNNNNY